MSVFHQRLPKPDPGYGSILSEAHGRLNAAVVLLSEVEAHLRSDRGISGEWTAEWLREFINEASDTRDKLYALMRLDETTFDGD